MSLALIQLAYTQPKKLENGQMSQKQTVPSGQPILKLKNMDQVLLPTQTLKVSKSGNYLESPDFVGVSQFPVSFLNKSKFGANLHRVVIRMGQCRDEC